MLKKFRPVLDARGDTIVEVLIVLAVLGLAISISYATANRSLLNARQAQENSIATEIAQSQVEGLASLGCTSGDPACDPTNPSNPSYQLFHQPGAFCLTASYSLVASTNAACKIDSLYQIKVTYNNNASQPSTFEVLITWPDVIAGTDTVRQDYTLPDVAAGGGGGGGGGGVVGSCPAGTLSYADKTVTGGVTLNKYGTKVAWGSGPYTDDSALGTAAVHAGLISIGQTALIRVCELPGQSSYTGSTQNGVTTSNWGSWPGSISLILLNGGINPSLAISGCSGPVGVAWSGKACESSDKVSVTISGVSAGDKCTVKDDRGDNSGSTMLNLTAAGTTCTGSFNMSKFGAGQTDYLTAYVTDSGNNYNSNSVSLDAWAYTPTSYACSWNDPTAHKGFSNWYFTVNGNGCLPGTSCYQTGGSCGTYAPTFSGYQNFDVACQSGSIYVYGTTWTGSDNSGQPCPPGTTRISRADPPPGSLGPPGGTPAFATSGPGRSHHA